MADTILQAHSSVLSAQCPYFSKALLRKCTGQDGHNVVPRFIESENREFNFPEGSVQAYARVIRYLYLRNYSDEPDMELNTPGKFRTSGFCSDINKCTDDEELTRDVRVYQLADYFGIDDLQVYALGKFKTMAKSLWMSQGFIDCIPEVYASTTDAQCQMRRAVIDINCEHSEDDWKELEGPPARGGIRCGLAGSTLRPRSAQVSAVLRIPERIERKFGRYIVSLCMHKASIPPQLNASFMAAAPRRNPT